MGFYFELLGMRISICLVLLHYPVIIYCRNTLALFQRKQIVFPLNWIKNAFFSLRKCHVQTLFPNDLYCGFCMFECPSVIYCKAKATGLYSFPFPVT